MLRGPISSLRVEGHRHVGPHPADDFDDLPRDTVQVCSTEGLGMLVAGRAGHPGVPIPQETQVGHAQGSGGLSKLLLPDLAEVLWCRQGWVADFTGLALGGTYQDNPDPFRGIPGEEAAAAEGLVILVGHAG